MVAIQKFTFFLQSLKACNSKSIKYILMPYYHVFPGNTHTDKNMYSLNALLVALDKSAC